MTKQANRTPARAPIDPSPFDAFYKGWRGKTPANAIRLAIADHVARDGGICDFVSALRQAERIVEADAERDKITANLVAALRTIRDITSPGLAAASKFTDMDPRERLADIYAKARAALKQAES